jgi:signal transduction histidine kinase
MRGMKLEAPALLALFEQAAAGIVLGSPDGHATLNPAARQLLGLPSEAPVSALPRPALVDEALGGAAVTGALVEWNHGGPSRLLVVSWAPLRESGRIVAALGVIQDASSRGGAEALPPTPRMSDEFYALIAHQLRTPLTPILGWARMLMQQRPDDPVLRRAAEVIERNVRIEVKLVDDMLDVTRIQRGTLELVMRPVDVSDICRGVVAEQRRWIEGRSLPLDLNVPDRPLAVNGDPARVEQIVTALVANAVRFTPDGGRVMVSAAREGSDVVCVVTDSGEGITPTLLPRIFDFSLEVQHGAGRRGGLGVSLAIGRYLAERHGGSLTGESEGPARGARFTLRLPAMEEA